MLSQKKPVKEMNIVWNDPNANNVIANTCQIKIASKHLKSLKNAKRKSI